MSSDNNELPTDIDTLQKMIKELQNRNDLLEQENQTQQMGKLAQLYQHVTGEEPKSQLTSYNYALGIYHYLDSIIALVPGHIYWQDRNNVYLGCNDEHARTAGISSRHMILGKTNADMSWRQKADELDTTNNKIMATGEAIILEETVETIYGKQIFLSQKVPLRNEQGEVIGLLGTSIDITERKKLEFSLLEAKERAETAIKAKNEFLEKISKEVIGNTSTYQTAEEYALAVRRHLENIIACMPGNVYWMDRNSVYMGCNDNVLKFLGLDSRKDFIGMTYDDITKISGWSEGQGDFFKRNDQEVMLSDRPMLNVEDPPVTDAGGNLHYYLTSRVPLRDVNNQVTGIVGISVDITELKKTQFALAEAKEKAETAIQTKSIFMENMSHDFKTPLNGIYGVVQILSMRRRELPDDIKELVDVQEISVKRLKKLIDSILDYNKLQAGKVEIQHEELNLLDIIESVVHNLSYQLKNKDLNLNISYPADVPRHLISDSYCVTSIILNLMSNAVKFTKSGHVNISVNTLSKNEKMTLIQITVEDTGRGIPSDKLEQIFDRFHRLEMSNKGLTEGHGIGLAVVKELVDKLNGEIEVKSEIGKGTTFTVNLPFDILKMAFFVSEWKKRHPTIRILLGSDKSSDTILDQLGKNIVSIVKSKNIISELLSAASSQNPYQIIIIDDEIKLLEPLDLIKTIFSIKEIPKLMWLLSSHPQDKEWFDTARAAGYFDFIIKPILPSELDEKLTAAWEKWQKK